MSDVKLTWFGLVWFYGISAIVGCLIPNPVFTYILNTYDLLTYFVDTNSLMISSISNNSI